MQADVVRSEQEVRIAERKAQSNAEFARGEAAAVRLRADAEADATRAVGAAKADSYRAGVEALGGSAFTAMQLAAVLGEHNVKLVPDVAVNGGSALGGLPEALLARLLGGVKTPSV
jgi:uncharacterized membrane protein YqiK